MQRLPVPRARLKPLQLLLKLIPAAPSAKKQLLLLLELGIRFLQLLPERCPKLVQLLQLFAQGIPLPLQQNGLAQLLLTLQQLRFFSRKRGLGRFISLGGLGGCLLHNVRLGRLRFGRTPTLLPLSAGLAPGLKRRKHRRCRSSQLQLALKQPNFFFMRRKLIQLALKPLPLQVQFPELGQRLVTLLDRLKPPSRCLGVLLGMLQGQLCLRKRLLACTSKPLLLGLHGFQNTFRFLDPSTQLDRKLIAVPFKVKQALQHLSALASLQRQKFRKLALRQNDRAGKVIHFQADFSSTQRVTSASLSAMTCSPSAVTCMNRLTVLLIDSSLTRLNRRSTR